MGNGVYRMTVEDSQSSLQDYYSYSGKFRVNSTESEINCTVSFGNEENSTFFLDNTAVRKSQSYFYINSSDINGADCNGQVSWDKGCVLTLDTSNIDTDGEIIRQYDSSASYNQSVSNGGSLTVVSGCEPGNSNCYSDSNRIIKVVKNRECSEWLACRSSSYSTEVDGSVKEYCYDLGRCTELSPSGNNCIQWREMDDEILTEDVYTSRETGWSGQEYSGYSLLNKYNLESLLARTKLDNYGSALELSYEGNESDGVGNGPDGGIISPTCRLFPSEDAPFSTVGLNGIAFDDLGNIITKPLQMPQANFCSQNGDCECDYQKVTYSQGEERYFRSDYSGFDTIDYGDGVKSTVKSVNDYRGFWGFCLERDYSRTVSGYAGGEHPCLTWMPLDILSGEYNPLGVDIEEDLNVRFSSMYYCTQAEGNFPYTGEFSQDTQINLGENAVQNPDEVWNTGYSCGYSYSSIYPSDSSAFNDKSTFATCMVSGQASPVISTFDRNNSEWIEPEYSKYRTSLNSISFNNIAAGWGVPGHGDYFKNGIDSQGDLYCFDDNQWAEPECELLDLLPRDPSGNNSPIVLNIDNSFDCTSGSMSEDFCKGDDATIWVRAFYTIEGVSGAPGTTYENASWNEFSKGFSDTFPYLLDYSGCGTLGSLDGCSLLSGGYNNLRNDWNDEAMYVFFIVAFDENDQISRYEISYLVPSIYKGVDNVGIAQGYIYDVTINSFMTGTESTERCNQFIRVESPKFNNFGSNAAVFNDVAGNSIDLLPSQYYDWYGMSNIKFDSPINLNGYSTDISVKRASINTEFIAGTPYSVVSGKTIGKLSDAPEGIDFGVDSDDDELITAINSNDNANVLTWLRSLFANIKERFYWAESMYQRDDTFTGISSLSQGLPLQLRQVVNNENGEVTEGGQGITINDRNNEDINHEGRIYDATIKFYAYNENGNQLPITELMVDWGDGSTKLGDDGASVSLKNHKNYCINNCSISYLGYNTFNGSYFRLVNLGSENPNRWQDDEAILIQEPGWNGNYSSEPTRNYSGIYLEHGVLLEKPKFQAGDTLTLEYDYKIEGTISTPVLNYWCYGAGWCSQMYSDGTFGRPGQTESYNDKMIYFARLDTNLTTGSSCPDGSDTRDGWCTYSSTGIVTSDMVTGCVNDENLSGYCLREMGIALRSDRVVANNETIRVKNVRLRTGCRNNSECPGNTNLCEPENIGNDLRYCVDDYQNGIGYFSFNHTYICSDPAYNDALDQRDDACVYKPRVYVEDNWGKCSKTICDPNENASWEIYGGTITLEP